MADTVILGGGIHGVSLAYFLAKKSQKPLIIESVKIAAAASGKAGGFLAREWGSGPTVQLHQKSFDLHKLLASELHIDSYRSVNTLNVDGSKKGKNIATWLDKKTSSTLMDTGTAQVTPAELTEKLLRAAQSDGVEVLIDTAIGVVIENEKVVGVKLKNNGIVQCNNVVICLGPWSGKINKYNEYRDGNLNKFY
jgi:glycine/D-amino acid oxidase-like deaminating enzyme